jgi:hypothetical protein
MDVSDKWGFLWDTEEVLKFCTCRDAQHQLLQRLVFGVDPLLMVKSCEIPTFIGQITLCSWVYTWLDHHFATCFHIFDRYIPIFINFLLLQRWTTLVITIRCFGTWGEQRDELASHHRWHLRRMERRPLAVPGWKNGSIMVNHHY